MDKCIIGSVLLAVSGVLFGMKYMTAAIYMAGGASQSRELFASGWKYTGNGLLIAAAMALAAGVLFIALGEYEKRR